MNRLFQNTSITSLNFFRGQEARDIIKNIKLKTILYHGKICTKKNIRISISLIKNSVNKLPLYSVLNPDTNSDSPSTKSTGVRLPSIKSINNNNKTTINLSPNNEIISKISNEIISIIIRILPYIEYLFSLIIDIPKNNSLNIIRNINKSEQTALKIIKDNIRNANPNKLLFLLLDKSLTPSIIVCNTPIFHGPTRNWDLPNICRSNNTTKATDTLNTIKFTVLTFQSNIRI